MFEEATATGREDRQTSDATGISAKRVTLNRSFSLIFPTEARLKKKTP
jgi:hypothetical protein